MLSSQCWSDVPCYSLQVDRQGLHKDLHRAPNQVLALSLHVVSGLEPVSSQSRPYVPPEDEMTPDMSSLSPVLSAYEAF